MKQNAKRSNAQREACMKKWNTTVACNAPSKREIRKSKRALRSMKRNLLNDFDDYMEAIYVAQQQYN